ncbi:putative nudix hydrolase 6 [Trichostrongylus colubriformis]|uniref:Nudix hydrolase 6 n=1 Tax=Trichostrongylus colubriformis TaxID=6319 RepID=A0AAN8IMB3_TRICO
MLRRSLDVVGFMSIWNHLVCRSRMIHKKCRYTDVPYLRSNVYRCKVPDEKLRWSVPFPEYNPPDYTDPKVLGKSWADPDAQAGGDQITLPIRWSLESKKENYNLWQYNVQTQHLDLFRWGPNHAADPLVTRIKEGKLQFVAIQRSDTGEWAIPGGMVEAGEQVSETLKREFTEEALGGKARSELDRLWAAGQELYRGYVDDPRNTDNAWMETVCVNFHDCSGLLDKVELQIMSRRAPPPIEGLYSLKVDNISYNTTQADLRRMFDKYGEIGDIHIPRDKYTRQSKGFGFVRFYRRLVTHFSRRDAEYAMDRTDGRWVEGREIRVAMARYERPIDERGAYTRRGRSRSRSPRRRSRSRSPRRSRSRSPRSKSRSASPRRSRSRSASPRGGRRSASPNGKGESPERAGSETRGSRSRSRSGSP